MTVRSVAGGLLVQDRDRGMVAEDALQVVSKRQPTPAEIADLLFAWRVAKYVKSNAIVYARDGATAGVGAGQMSRVDSAMIAARKAEEAGKAAGLDASLAKGSVCASDAFFPFPDGLIAAAEAGCTAVIQPGGSMRDDAVIAAADERGTRHGRHRHAPLPALAAVAIFSFTAAAISAKTPAQSPRAVWRKSRIVGYQGESSRPAIQRQSGSSESATQTGRPSAPARWATAVSDVTTRSRPSMTAATSAMPSGLAVILSPSARPSCPPAIARAARARAPPAG